MSDTLTTPTSAPAPSAGAAVSAPVAPAASPAPASPAPTSGPKPTVSEASKQWLASLPENAWSRPITGPDDADTQDTLDTLTTESQAQGEYTVDAAGRAHGPDGKFVAKPGDAPAETPADEPDVPVAPTEGEQAAEPAGDPITLTLAGLAERGEADIPLELPADTPTEIVDRLRRLQNDGLRRKDYDTQVAALQQEASAFQAVVGELMADPVAFMLAKTVPERQVEIARYLVAEHWDTLYPELVAFEQDATKRYDQRVGLRDRVTQARTAATTQTQEQQYYGALEHAARSLVPEHVDPASAELFFRDAVRDIADAIQSGRPVRPDELSAFLAPRMKLHGFTAAAPSAPAVAPASGASAAAAPVPPSTAPIARPVTDRAKAVATPEAVRAVQLRIQRTQQARQTLAAVAPAGAGAVTVRPPLVPKGADIATASKALRKVQSWTELGR